MDLGKLVVSEMLARTDLDPMLIDQLVFGQVVQMPEAPNIAREIVLGTGMSVSTDAYSVSRACATSFQAVANVTGSIMAGTVDIAIAGGADSSSVLPIRGQQVSGPRPGGSQQGAQPSAAFQHPASPASEGPAAGTPAVASTPPVSLPWGRPPSRWPRPTRSATRRKMRWPTAPTWRPEAWAQGKLSGGCSPPTCPYKSPLERDNNIREGSDLMSYAKLKPVFDRAHGSVTAANATPLTDGAAAVLMMREGRARELGLEPLGYIPQLRVLRHRRVAGHADGPPPPRRWRWTARASPLADLTLIGDMQRSFAAQTLANLKMFASADCP